MNTIRILIVDDHPVVRHGLRGMLSTAPHFEVIGEAASGGEALQAVTERSPDIVLLDIRLGEQDGIQIARQIRGMAPSTRVILLTVHDDPEYVSRALEADVHGYLLKGSDSEDIMRSIERVMAGERVITAALQTQVLENYIALAQARTRRDADLSTDELGILNGMTRGMDYKSIAASLHLSEMTVRRRVQELYRKLGVTDRAEAVAVSIRRGLI